MKNLTGVLIILGVLLGIGFIATMSVVSTYNRAIGLEEQVFESRSAIQIQEQRRVDLILNLVDIVQAYDRHESETLLQIVEARSQANAGNVEEAGMILNVVMEAYPELKSQANYQELMNELSITENLIARHRQDFNTRVRQYNQYVRRFPNRMLLDMMGFERQDFTYLEFDAQPISNLFGE